MIVQSRIGTIRGCIVKAAASRDAWLQELRLPAAGSCGNPLNDT